MGQPTRLKGTAAIPCVEPLRWCPVIEASWTCKTRPFCNSPKPCDARSVGLSRALAGCDCPPVAGPGLLLPMHLLHELLARRYVGGLQGDRPQHTLSPLIVGLETLDGVDVHHVLLLSQH